MPLYQRVVRETLDYVLRDMTRAEGGFAAPKTPTAKASRASSISGRPTEIAAVLETGRRKPSPMSTTSPPRATSRAATSCTSPRRWKPGQDARPGDGLRWRPNWPRIAASCWPPGPRRVRPRRDDKVAAELERADDRRPGPRRRGAGRARYGQAAARAADFLLDALRDGQGRSVHSWRAGRPGHAAFLDDYASLANALARSTSSSPSGVGSTRPCDWPTSCWRSFADPRQGGFFYTADDQEPLIVRKKDLVDNSVPSGNGLAVTALLRLADLAHRDDYRQAAENTLRACMGILERAPTATGQLLLALEMTGQETRFVTQLLS